VRKTCRFEHGQHARATPPQCGAQEKRSARW
jgi:hypothetical protein